MSGRILTLFGEEMIPEQQPKPAPKPRAKKTAAKEEPSEPPKEPPAPEQKPVPAIAPFVPEPLTEDVILYDPAVVAEMILLREEPQPIAGAETTPAEEPAQPEPRKEVTFDLPDDWKSDKKYHTIGEVAKLFNVKTSHIRFWTNEFKLKVRTTRKGDRLYTPDQVRELKAIHHLVKERGFTLNGAKTKLKTQNKRDVETIDLKQSLLQLRNKLVIMKKQLDKDADN
jgi:DNA-binding transcriptional MerR regulator